MPKGSTSGDVCNFKIIETGAVVKIFFLQGKLLKEMHAILTETLREYTSSYATTKK
jgi:hypothetical protein